MSIDSPASILFDTNGNQVGVIQDGYIYRLQVEAKSSPNNITVSQAYELPTFNAISTNISTDLNKSLMSIVNTGAKIVRVEEIYLINVRTTNVTGVQGVFEIRRIGNHSSGTLVTNVEAYETSDVLDVGITVRTGATISGESTNLLWRNLFSTDEYGIMTENVSSTEHSFQTMFPVFVKKTNKSKTITLKTNEGLTIKFTPNSFTGLFDIFCVFTQE